MRLKLEPYQALLRDFFLRTDRAYTNVGLGLGKTASTLDALNTLFMDGAIRSALVVAPLRVARMTWPNEIKKWDQFRWMKTEILAGSPPSGQAQIYLINYERLQQLKTLDFCDVVVFDEITKAKNHASLRIKAIRPLLKHHRRWGLTGTPRPNSLLELFAQIRLLDDGSRLGRAFSSYRDCYFIPTDYMRYNWAPKTGAEDRVYDKISDMTMTLRSSDFLDVPDTILEDIEVTLPPKARKAYDDLEKDFLIMLRKEVVAQNAAVLAGKLHQIAGGNIYNEAKEAEELHDVKIAALKALVKRHPGEPLLVACQYVHERERVCRAFPQAVDAAKFKGDIEAAWNTGKIPLLVADPRSMGHGLNLQQGGRIVVWYSPTWSRELYDQFNARVARKGQTEQPLLYRIVALDTIDEAILITLRERGDAQHLMAKVMSSYLELFP